MDMIWMSVGAVALFTFLSVAVWTEERRKEREAFYRTEMLKKVAEQGGGSMEQVLATIHEEQRAVDRRRLEGLKLGGLVTTAVGVGIVVFLSALGGNKPIHLVGLIPLLVGAALLIYAYLLARKP